MNVINDLVGYEKLKIVQNKDYFNFSLDSVLLPNFCTINKNTNKILDIGCGNAPIPLILSTKTNAKIVGIEIQKEIYSLACETIKINNLEERISIINADIKDYYKNFEHSSFDLVLCNPPYFKVRATSNLNQNEVKTIARHEVCLKLEDVISISSTLLKKNGLIAMVHRADRLIEIIDLMKKCNIEPKKIRFVYPNYNSDCNIVLIEGSKKGNSGLKIMPPLYCHNSDGTYTEDVKKFLK